MTMIPMQEQFIGELLGSISDAWDRIEVHYENFEWSDGSSEKYVATRHLGDEEADVDLPLEALCARGPAGASARRPRRALDLAALQHRCQRQVPVRLPVRGAAPDRRGNRGAVRPRPGAGAQGICSVTCPGKVTWITPAHMHISLLVLFSEGMLASSTVGEPGTHLNTIDT